MFEVCFFIGLFLFFVWCLVSPFMPKDTSKSGVVIHNDIHINNAPANHNDRNEYREYKQLYYDPRDNKPRKY